VSLLKRIEQGQADEAPAPSGNNSGVPATSSASRMSGISARRATPPGGGQRDTYYDLKTRVQNKLLAELDPSMDVSQTAEVRQTIEELFENILAEEKIVLSRPERRRLFEQIVAEILGLGPLEPLLADGSITEIMVNGAKQIYIERSGKLHREPATFESDDHLMRIIDRIVAPLGRRIDESSPYVDARLTDGSRVNAIIPPISLVGPVLTIRKFSRDPITVEQLIEWGTITPEAVEFLKASVVSAINMVVSGGTGSGKTTMLNILSGYIPNDERIVTIENAAELQLRQEHVVTLESRPPNIEGRGEVTIQNLVVNSVCGRTASLLVKFVPKKRWTCFKR
jgi:pilus assembly protein CpaF